MKVPFTPEAPAKGLKPVHTLVVFAPFSETLAAEVYQAWLALQPGAAVRAVEEKTRLADLLARTGGGGLFGDVEVLKLWRMADGGKFTTKESLEALGRVLNNPDTATPLFICIENPGNKPAWLKHLQDAFSKGAHAQLVEIAKLYEKDARALAARLSRQAGLMPTPGALNEMVRMTEGMPDRLNNEIHKLRLYTEHPKGEVSEADVKAVFDPAAEENTFQLLDDLAAGDRTRLLLRLREFSSQASQFPRELLLGSFYHMLETLLEVQGARETVFRGVRGYSQVNSAVQAHRAELAPKLRGIHPFILTKYVDLASKLGQDRLVHAAISLHHLDRVLKGAAHSAADPYDLMGEWLVGLLPHGAPAGAGRWAEK